MCTEEGVEASALVQHQRRSHQWSEFSTQCRGLRGVYCYQLPGDAGTSEDQEGTEFLQGLALSQTLEANSGAVYQITSRREHAQTEQVKSQSRKVINFVVYLAAPHELQSLF
jgi:hypothetical protein